MKRILVSLLVFLALHLNFVPGLAAERGDTIFAHDFEDADALRLWGAAQSPAVRLTTDGPHGRALQLERTDATTPSLMLRVPLAIEKLRGARLNCAAVIKAEGVSAPPKPWNGIKFMLHFVTPQGEQWPQWLNAQSPNAPGVFPLSFDWRAARFQTVVPLNATAAYLVLGLEEVTGRAGFDNVRISVATPPRPPAPRPPVGPVYKGHSLPRLRGAMTGQVSADDLRLLGKTWGANHVRWQLTWGGFPASPADSASPEAYDAWLEGQLKRLDALLPVCAEAGLLVLIDLHTPPGGRDAAHDCRLFQEQRWQQQFVAVWQKIARRYKGNRAVWGYDLVNEPVEGTLGDTARDWYELATLTAQKVRAIDAAHAIIIEAAPWGGPGALANFQPLPLSRIVYSFHMYEPHQFTHQGVYDKSPGISYPGTLNGKRWDKAALRAVMQPVAQWARRHNAHIYVGEFSAIRWAPGDSAFNYLRDCIEIFEENNWDWAYHAFREWDGWSLEHGPDQNDHARAAAPTAREQLFRAWFAKNRKPVPQASTIQAVKKSSKSGA